MRRYQLYFILIFFIILLLGLIFAFIYYLPARASLLFGPPSPELSVPNRIEFSTRLLMHGDVLTTPLYLDGIEQRFSVEPGESVFSIANRLEEAGFISSAEAFYDYVVYTGIDLSIQSGDFRISPAQSIIDIAKTLQKFSPTDATLVILSGWRMEEVAGSLSTSGLDISPDTFVSTAQTPPQVLAEFSPQTMEGFFFPDSYTIPRETTVDQLLDIIARNFTINMTEELKSGFKAQGLDIYDAVILASIVERESVQDEEMPLIASVFFNRINNDMTLGADPTVQYALGYDPLKQSWWKNPLSLEDLKFDSPYNTYIYHGLPPAPISNPGLHALQAVAFPDVTDFYYFQAKCDGSGYHTFAVTFEEHLGNSCP